jgi:cysteine-rich secretory family protein
VNEIDDPYYGVRLALVERINRDRADAGLSGVEFDPLSAAVADHHCQEMAAARYLSHQNQQGLLPYHRYHLAGGRDHVQENLSRITVFSGSRSPIGTQPPEILPRLTEAHERMVAEKPPLDGHRKTILDPAHTHVGIGFAVVEGEFTMAEEFLNRYVHLNELPLTLPNTSIAVEGEMLRKGFGPYFCALFYEGEPAPRTPYQLERTYAYSDSEGDECVAVRPWEMRFDPSSGRFRFSLQPKNCGPGFYHLLLWVRNDIRSIPYQLQMGVNKVETKQGVAAAGWVFRR